MRLILQSPKISLNKAFLKKRPLRSQIDIFKKELITLLDGIDNAESEEFNKNLVNNFLRHALYPENFINTKGRQDLVIYNGKDNKSTVGVIIETKRPNNKSEWFTADNPNGKAIQELVLYYLRERIEEENIDIKYVIATNINEWYIIEAKYFERLFLENKSLVKDYNEWRDGKKVTKDTDLFYNKIVKPTIDKIAEEIPCTYFDIRKYLKELKNADKEDDKTLIALLKVLSPYHLLKEPFANDSNELDQNFYTELLYIIGLEEVKEDGKFLIRRKKENRSPASLLEMAIKKLKTKGTHKLPDLKVFGDTSEEQLFAIALELCITWINRILFLKLLEGQLMVYHKGNKNYLFLNKSKVRDFDELFNLFHNVLAVRSNERDESLNQKFVGVPYLNSSLFEITNLEDLTISIDSLDNSEEFELISTTVLKDAKKKGIRFKTLEYLFSFLDSFDFASEGSEDIQEDNKPLINASVLGKVFEKINGYKDGSIYTPGYVTMFMCRETLRRATMEKFNSVKGWKLTSFDELYNHIDNISEANEIINSLKICDPAVGSGHFLVSALNEIISIKNDLELLVDNRGKRLKNYKIEIDNDELYITDEDGDFFDYHPGGEATQRVQETLFKEKQRIIENCLFGVDVNPNSVKICRLRLWIELLKNAYYTAESGYKELETLPNIDINIKCGNSLINRFSLDADLKPIVGKQHSIESYRAAVRKYQEATNKDEKREMESFIDSIKKNFTSELGFRDKLAKDFIKERNKVVKISSEINRLKEWKEKIPKTLLDELAKAKRKQEELEGRVREVQDNKIFKTAFEWRFEFPEILDNDGNFLGFDVIIGNPPYIRQEEVKEFSKYFQKEYKTHSGKADIYVYFYERAINLLRDKGIISYITSGKFFEARYGKTLAGYLINNTRISSIINFNDLPVFEGVTAYPLIYTAEKDILDEYSFTYYDLKEIPKKGLKQKLQGIKPLTIDKKSFIHNDFKFVDDKISSLVKKIKRDSVSLKEICGLPVVGVKTGFNDGYLTEEPKSEFVKPYVFGRDIKKYQKVSPSNRIVFPYNQDFSIPTGRDATSLLKMLHPFKEKLSQRAIIRDGLESGSKVWYEYQQVNKTLLYNKEYIVYPNVSLGNNFTLSKGSIIDMTAFVIRSNSRYLLGILNSKLVETLMKIWSISRRGGYLEYKVQYVEKIPIKKVSDKDQKPIIELVDKILVFRESGKNTIAIEQELDKLVYRLYSLTSDEIKLIESY